MVLFDNKLDERSRILRVYDLEDCKKLAQKHSFYYANGDNDRELRELWVSQPDNAASASYGYNNGFYVGMDEIRRFYVDEFPDSGRNRATLHPMSTWALQVAKDGKTAYGIWNVFAYETFENADGTVDGWWINENCAMDFAREADGWKIWRFFTGCDLFVRAGDDLSTYRSEIAPGDHVPDPRAGQFCEPTIACTAFSGKYLYQGFPPLPKEHDTWTPEQSCGPEALSLINAYQEVKNES